ASLTADGRREVLVPGAGAPVAIPGLGRRLLVDLREHGAVRDVSSRSLPLRSSPCLLPAHGGDFDADHPPAAAPAARRPPSARRRLAAREVPGNRRFPSLGR